MSLLRSVTHNNYKQCCLKNYGTPRNINCQYPNLLFPQFNTNMIFSFYRQNCSMSWILYYYFSACGVQRLVSWRQYFCKRLIFDRHTNGAIQAARHLGAYIIEESGMMTCSGVCLRAGRGRVRKSTGWSNRSGWNDIISHIV